MRVVRHHCTRENFQRKHELSVVPTVSTTVNWPRDSQKLDLYINEEVMYELLFSSQQPKTKDCRRHCFNVLFPEIRRQLTNKMKEEHEQAIEEKDNQIQTLEFTNEKHQQKILRLNKEIADLIANNHLARCGCFDNVLCFIKKNSGKVRPYYIIRCQYRQLEKHKRLLRLRYPSMEVADKCDDPNAVHRWNRFKREVIKKPNYYKNHFRLTEEKRELLEIALDVTI